MADHRKAKILGILTAHPGGLCAKNLLAAASEAGRERIAYRATIYRMQIAGQLAISGKKHRSELDSALVQMAAPK